MLDYNKNIVTLNINIQCNSLLSNNQCRGRCLTVVIGFVLVLSLSLFAQHRPFHRDSLKADSTGNSAAKVLQDGLAGLVKGIFRGDYRPYGQIEYIPESAIDLPNRLLPSSRARPRLLTLAQINAARSNRLREPYADWEQLLLTRANQRLRQPLPSSADLVVPYAEDIKILAWLYRLTNQQRYRDRAIALLLKLPPPPEIINLEGGDNSRGWGDYLLSAEALPALWVALDLLWYDLTLAQQLRIRGLLTGVAQQLADALWFTPANNHVTLMATAVLITALAEEEPQLFISEDRNSLWRKGLEYLSRSLGLVAPDGGYAEGVYYAGFILNYLAPLAVYWENASGDRLFAHPYMERLINWVLANDKNSGSYAAFDDAFQIDFFYLPLIVHQSASGAAWRNVDSPEFTPRQNLVEAMAVFRPGISSAIVETSPAAFFPDYGQIVFRDNSNDPTIWSTFLSERRDWFADRHEHIDPLSFELSAFGEDLIVDAGYGRGTGDPDRQWYLAPEAHNGILVNGRGTYRNPWFGDPLSSRIEQVLLTRSSAGAVMRHQISGVDLQRSVYFMNRSALLMIDRYEAGRPVSIALNFNHTGSISRTAFHQHRIKNGASQLELITLNSERQPLNYSYGQGLFTTKTGPQNSRQMRVEASNATSGAFVTVMLPSQESSRYSITQLPISGRGEAISVQGYGDNGSGQLFLLANQDTLIEYDHWKTDARFLVLNNSADGEVNSIYLEQGQKVKLGQYAISATAPVTIFLEKQDYGWVAMIEDFERWPATITLSGFNVDALRFNSRPLPFTSHDAGIDFVVEGGGTLQINAGNYAVPQWQQSLPNADLLSWLARSPDQDHRYAAWSGYQQQVFRNQMVSALQSGFSSGLEYWSERLTGNRELPFQVIDLSAGIGRASYDRNAASTYQLRFPHRFEFREKIQDYRFSVSESGEFSFSDWQMRYLGIGVTGKSAEQYRWLSSFVYDDVQTHQLFLQPKSGVNATATVTRAGSGTGFDGQVFYRYRGGFLAPGFSRSAAGDRQTYTISGGVSQWQAHVLAARHHDQRYLSPVITYSGQKLRFTIRNDHSLTDGSGAFAVSSWFSLLPAISLYPQLAGHYRPGALDNSTAILAGSWQTNRSLVRAAAGRANYRGFQEFGGYWQGNKQRWSGLVLLGQRGRDARTPYLLNWRLRSESLGHSHEIRLNRDGDNLSPELRHQLSFSVRSRWALQPLLAERFSNGALIAFWGLGSQFYGKLPFAMQWLHDYRRRYWTGNLIVELNRLLVFLPGFQLDFAGTRDQLQTLEIRIYRENVGYGPGIYYRYWRDGTARLEGFLQWKW